MSIDWLTVVAQIVNFLILVWLLKRFLYRPILDGIDAREQQIAQRMAEADKVRQAAETTQAEYRAKRDALSAERELLATQARRAAEAERDALLADTRTQLTREREQRDAQRAEDARRYSAALHRTGATALLALTRKALADLSDETLEQRIVAHAVTRVAAETEPLTQAAGGNREAIITTRTPLPQDLREQLSAELAPVVGGHDPLFRTDASQPLGLSLQVGSAQLGWTVDSYIDALDALLCDGAIRKQGGFTDAA